MMPDTSRPPNESTPVWRRIRRRALRETRALSFAWSRGRSGSSDGRRTGTEFAANGAASAELRRWCYRTGGTGKGLWWPAFPPTQYLGQLTPEFQKNLNAQWSEIELDDCYFYHTSVLADERVIPGPWDLRGSEHQYIGEIDVSGERVLELGPATGALTYFMEDEGAEVVSFDVGFDVCGDILPKPGLDPLLQKHDFMDNVARVQNSWWFLHNDRRSTAKVAYGNIYSLPGDFGVFDTSVFGAILLHLRDPFAALQAAAQHTRNRIVVTEPAQELPLGEDVQRFAHSGNDNGWWTLTPEEIRVMLRRLGFTELQTSFSSHVYYPNHDMSIEPVQQPMVTIIGSRND